MRDDWHAAAAVIRACEPDVVCVQEAPRFLRWRSKRAALAREAGLVVATADRVGGLMLLTSLRVDVRRTSHDTLSKRPHLHQRAVVAAEVTFGGQDWTVASVHLSLDPAERALHLSEVVAALASYDSPVVVAGDINEEPDAPTWRGLAVRWQDAYAVAPSGEGDTYSAARPHKRIDAVFADPRIEVVSCGVPDVPGTAVASDHRPVLAVLRQR